MTMNRGQARVIDPVLSQVALGYKDAEFVGSELFPEVTSPSYGARVIRFKKEAFLKYNLRRAPGAKTARVQFGYASDPIALVQDSVEGKVPREFVRDASQVPNINHGSMAVRSSMRILRRGLEIDQAALAQDAAQYDANHKVTLGVPWSNATSDPKAEIDTGKNAVRASIGVEPNTLVVPYNAFVAAQNHAAIRDQFKYTSAQSITAEMLAQYFGLQRVVVGKGVYAVDETSDFVDIWSKGILAYVAQGGFIEEPSFGYTYVGDGQPLSDSPYWDQSEKSWIYPVEFERKPYVTAVSGGYLIDGIQ